MWIWLEGVYCDIVYSPESTLEIDNFCRKSEKCVVLRQLILVLEINSIWLIELLDISGVLISTWEKTMNFPPLDLPIWWQVVCGYCVKWSVIEFLCSSLESWRSDEQRNTFTAKDSVVFFGLVFPIIVFPTVTADIWHR